MNLLERFKTRARALKTETLALTLAFRDPRTPWFAKAWAALVLAYALSPIDLIPDFVPILGYLDDLILVPAGLALALKLIPGNVMEDARRQASRGQGQTGPFGRWGVFLILLLWMLIALWIIWCLSPFLRSMIP